MTGPTYERNGMATITSTLSRTTSDNHEIYLTVLQPKNQLELSVIVDGKKHITYPILDHDEAFEVRRVFRESSAGEKKTLHSLLEFIAAAYENL